MDVGDVGAGADRHPKAWAIRLLIAKTALLRGLVKPMIRSAMPMCRSMSLRKSQVEMTSSLKALLLRKVVANAVKVGMVGDVAADVIAIEMPRVIATRLVIGSPKLSVAVAVSGLRARTKAMPTSKRRHPSRRAITAKCRHGKRRFPCCSESRPTRVEAVAVAVDGVGEMVIVGHSGEPIRRGVRGCSLRTHNLRRARSAW